MDSKKILEGNKLIANFMGIKNLCTEEQFLKYEVKRTKDLVIIESLKYDRDFNELIKVVDKIESLSENDYDKVSVEIYKYRTIITRWEDSNIIAESGGNARIENLYYAIIVFIKLYNDKTNKIKEIDNVLINCYNLIGIDKPSNHDDILKFVVDDVNCSADTNWSDIDVAIAFRRFIENK